MDPYADRLDELKDRMGRGLAPEVPEEVMKDRWSRCKALMKQKGLDVLVIYSAEQHGLGREWARYFANFVFPYWNGEALIVLPLEGEPALLINYGFLLETAQIMSPIKDVRAPMERFGSSNRYAGLMSTLRDVLANRGVLKDKIGIAWEGTQGDFSPWPLRQLIQETFAKERWEDASQVPFAVIMEKTDYDREMIRRTAEIASDAMKAALAVLREGVNEYEAYLVFQRSILEAGCDTALWHYIMQSGPGAHVALKPFAATGRKLKHGDMVLIDTGLCYQGYYNDMTRTAIIMPPNKEQRKLYDDALVITEKMASSLRPGVKVCDVVKTLRDGLKERGYTKTHPLIGHGIGIMCNEPPYFMDWNETVLKENWVVNLEPAVYLNDAYGGCRIEDTYLVTRKGGERLSTITQDLHVL